MKVESVAVERAKAYLRGVLMERIRQANYADLKSRVRSGQLHGIMFLHMKDDLFADPIEWVGSQEPTAASWVFAPELAELRNTDEKDRKELLQRLDDGARVVFNPD